MNCFSSILQKGRISYRKKQRFRKLTDFLFSYWLNTDPVSPILLNKKISILYSIDNLPFQAKSMQINTKCYTSFLNGVSSYEKMQYQNAIKYFVDSISNQSSNEPHKLTPQLLSKQASLNDISTFLHAVPFEPLSNLSSCLIKTRQYRQAQKICYQLLNTSPYISLPYYNLASIQIREEKYLQAINFIKCAISCEYLRKYERMLEKEALDKAIQYAPNNLQAIKYRIAHNYQYLSLVKGREVFLNTEELKSIDKIIKKLESDQKQYTKLISIYENKFYPNKNNPSFFISSVKPQFLLESNRQINQIFENDLENKLVLMKQLKHLRQLYLELLEVNEKEANFELFIEEIKKDLGEENQGEKTILGFTNDWKHAQSSISNVQSVTIQTEFELDDSSNHLPIKNITSSHSNKLNIGQNVVPNLKVKSLQRNTSIPNLSTPQNKQNNYSHHIKRQKSSLNHFTNSGLISVKTTKNKLSKLPIINKPCFISKFINEASEQEELKTSRNKATKESKNSVFAKDLLSVSQEKDKLNSSIISILDYDDTPSQFNINENYHPPTQMIESIIVHPPLKSEDQFIVDSHWHESTTEQFSLTKNRSHQNLFSSTLLTDTTKKLSHSRHHNQNMSLMVESKFQHHKLLSCSKCSIDHSTDQNLVKNVKLNINLTEVYNYPGDYSELQSFCVIKHLGQSYRTEWSKGKFPNWKTLISLSVDNLQQINFQAEEKRRIKIQLWAKSVNQKKDSSNHSLYGQQLIGEQYIDLKDEKWMKKKITLENRDKKTAYMYVCLEKIKE